MAELTRITEDELLHISTSNEIRLEAFTKSPKLDRRELASLARAILKDMGRPSNIIQDLIMMQTLKQLREDERKINKQESRECY